MPNVGYATLQVIPSVRGISNDLRRQLIGPAGDAGESAGEAAGGGFREAFTGTMAALGVAEIASKIGEQFADAFDQAIEQAGVAGQLKAQLGATGKDAARYGQVAGQLYTKGIVDDVQAGAEAVRATLSGGLVPPDATNKQLKSIAAQMADVSTTFGTDMGLQSQAVAAQLKNGLAPNAAAALDVITVGFQKLGPNAEDLLETFQEYPVQLRKLGLDSKTALGLFRQGIQGGARDTDIIADSLKEFSIRSIDMSAGSQAAYKALGLDAGKMSLQIAKGGKGASEGLQLVLDRLRAIKDPVKQQAAAVGLFGTQAEEMGSALLKLDPSKATAAMGDVSGAATQLGKDLHSGPAHEIEVFQRSLKQAFVNVIGGQVLPVLATAGQFMNRTVLPPLTMIGTAAASVLVPALMALWSAGTATVGWLRDMGTWLIPVGVAVVGFTAAILAQQIATLAVTAVFSIYRGAILAWTAVQRGATIAQAAFNAVMNANPIILVITAIVALGAALVIAYQRSETFRSIVQGAWTGIQSAALYAWNSVLKPAFAGLQAGVSAVGAAFLWLWTSAISPVFSFIDTAARILLTVITILVFGPIYLAVKALGAVFSWLWTSMISPVVGLIAAGLGLLWASAKVNFGYLTAGLRTVGKWATWLWRSSISPTVGLVVGGFQLLWASVQVIFGYFTTGLRTLGGWATWLHRAAVKPAFDAIGAAASWLWSKGLKPALDAGKRGVGLFGAAFGAAKDAIKIAWDKVKGIARAPIAFVVNTVYSKGVVPVWNAVAKAFGAPTLDAMKFARGGPVFGAGSETSDDVPAWLSTNEHVWTAKEVRGAGGHGAVMALRNWAAAGGRGQLPGFKDGGGLFGWIGKAASNVAGWGSAAWDKVKAGAKWLKDTLAASAKAGVNAVVTPLLSQIPGLGSGFGDMIAKVPSKMIDALFGYADKADAKGASDSFGGGKIPSGQHAAILRRALSAAGVPPPGTLGQWLSGLNTLVTRESGWNASAVNRTDINAKNGTPSQGLAQTIPGTFNAYVPASLRSRGILDPVANVAAAIRYIVARYGNITKVQQANANATPKGYARGGRPRPGEIAWVGEMGPELVRFGAGGATVWDSATSMDMAAGLGGLRGFAKGTKGAKARAAARKQVPGDLSSVSKILTASASDIKKAFDELTKDLRAAGGAGKTLAASSAKASAKLQLLAKQRDSVGARIEAAKTAAADQKKSAADFLGLSNLTDSGSVGDLIVGMKQRQSTVKDFQGTIASLSKRGLNQDLISQLVAMGPDSPLATLVGSASKSEIGQLNTLAKSGAKLTTSYGRTMADAMFDAGTNASKGFLTGLQSQEKALQTQMNKLGDGLVRSIKRKLKIKSPSRVTHWVGKMTGAGVGLGLDSTASTVAAAAARVADAAVPEIPTVSPASYTAAAATQGRTLASGNRLWLVLEDGRELAAYVDDRADGRVAAGFTAVRRKVRSGSK